MGYFWGYNIDAKESWKVQFLDYLQNRFRVFSYKDENIRDFVKQLEKASYLEGYSSMIYEVAKKIIEMDLGRNISIKLVKGTSEKIFDKYQEAAEKAFGKKIVSEYGAAETGIIAFECPQKNMHITMENVIVEEENKEVVVTNLVSNSFPIIRYKLGDYIELDETTKCPCGRAHYLIKEVMGRIGKVIYGHKETYPTLTLYYIFKNLAIKKNITLNYQAIQSTKGELNINIEQKLDEQKYKLLELEAKKYFGEDIKLIIKDCEKFSIGKMKRKDFISHID